MSSKSEKSKRPMKGNTVPGTHQEAYSIYWRKNLSNLEVTELALVLRATRKVAHHIGQNVKPIFWLGMSASQHNSILLNPDEIKGTYPISFEKMDVLVGQVVREAFCCIEWSEWIKDQVTQHVSSFIGDRKDYLDGFLDAAEDFYIFELTKASVWPLYLSKYWKTFVRKKERELSLPPTASSFANVWRKKVLLDIPSSGLHQYYQNLLQIMSNFMASIRNVKEFPTLGERRKKRVDIYIEMWELLYKALLEWETFEPSTDGVSIQDESGPKVDTPEAKADEEQEENKEEEQEDNDQGLDEELAQQVSFELDEGETDLTKHISVAVEDPEAKRMETIFSRAVAECNVFADKQQTERLKKIFKKQVSLVRRLKKKRMRRGVDMGKMDARRLYRVPLDGKIFKRNDISDFDYSWNISIVADASASMAGKDASFRPWTIAEQTFVSLAEASKGFINQIEVLGYQERGGQCNVIKLQQSGKLYTVFPTGRTPSGQAILAAALMMKKGNRKKLIIHITDGAANCGLNVMEALEFCQKNRIDLVTIGCGCNMQTEQFLLERYPRGTVYLMDNIRHLPEGLERLFQKKLLSTRYH